MNNKYTNPAIEGEQAAQHDNRKALQIKQAEAHLSSLKAIYAELFKADPFTDGFTQARIQDLEMFIKNLK